MPYSTADDDDSEVGSASIMISATTISPDFMVELSDNAIRAMSDWTITLPINGPFAITDTVTLTFPLEFMVSDATKVDNARIWMINGYPASEIDYTPADRTATLMTDHTPFSVQLTPRQGRGFSALEADDELVITYTAGGIDNPSTAVTGREVEAVTGISGDTAVTSAEFAIEVPNSPAEVLVTNSPTDPGAAAEYTIKFVTSARLEAGTAQIILDIDSSFGVPTSLSPSAVRIRANDIDGLIATGTTGVRGPTRTGPWTWLLFTG